IEAELDKLTVASGRKSRWVDLTKAFVAAMRESSTEKGRVDFKNGVFSLKDSVGVAVPIESPDVMASVEMRYVEGSEVKLEVRHTGKQCYFAWYSGDGQFTLGRWIKDDGITELVTKRLPSFNDRRFFELRLAALGDTLMVFVDGEQVIRTQDTELSAPGRVVMYVHQATAHYRKIRVRYPTPGEIKQMLAKKPG
ncbi:MAG: DUF1080 domain-containing protein, partial [Phycisphaerae bacterium]|nr:DUF1080 domain-containing protein [Phycisphaerae bacterium]